MMNRVVIALAIWVGAALAQYPYSGAGFAPSIPQAYPQQFMPQATSGQGAVVQAPQDVRFQQVAAQQIPPGMEQPRIMDPNSIEDPRNEMYKPQVSQMDDSSMVDLGTTAKKNCGDEDKECKLGVEKAPGNEDESRDPRLVAALEAVKSDLMAKGHQLVEEKKWLTDVKKMMTTYEKKMKNVQKSVISTKDTMKDLLKKKRQIENLQLQKQLKSKLATAKSDFESLQTVISHVKKRATMFLEKKKGVADTIGLIESQLEKLSGKKEEKPGDV